MTRYVVLCTAALLLFTGISSTASTQKEAENSRKQDANKEPASKAVQPKKADGPQPNKSADFMRLKLIHTQKVLEGIAVENFDAIAKQSVDLGLLAQDENWMVYQTLEYRQHTAEFQRIAARLTKAATDKNIDAAALAYVQLTMSCVDCHKHCRGVQLSSSK